MRVWKEYRFEAAHNLTESVPEGHKCRRLHGHSYRFRVHIEGPVDNGMVVEYSQIPGKEIVEALDHRYLNEVLPFETTAENLALWIKEQTGADMVEVFETCQTGVVA